MIRRFCSGSSTPGEAGQEALTGIDHHQVHAEVALERDPQQLRLLLAHQPVVDVDAGQPVADRAMHERRRDRRIDAARQGADDLAVRAGLLRVAVDPLADPGDRRVDEVGRPSRSARCSAMPTTKLRSTSRPRGVWTTSGWNWMPYRFRSGASRPANGVESVWAVAGKPSGRRGDRVAVAHPDGLLALDARRTAPSSAVIVTVAGPYSRLVVGQDVAAELAGHELGAVADAEDRDAAAPDRRVGLRGAVVVDRVRAARQDDRPARRGAPAPRAACRGAAAPSRRRARGRGGR